MRTGRQLSPEPVSCSSIPWQVRDGCRRDGIRPRTHKPKCETHELCPFGCPLGRLLVLCALCAPGLVGKKKRFSALLIQGSRLSSGIHSTTNTKHLQIVSFSSMRPGSDQRLVKNSTRIATDHLVTFLCGQVGSECRVESIRNYGQKNNPLSGPEPTTHRTT